MKLKLPACWGQRNPAWASIILGYNTDPKYNIDLYGCLITSFGNYIGKTPAEVNQLLKDNKGFLEGSGNFVWSKCSVLGLTQTYVSPSYTGPVTSQGITKIKELLDQGLSLICQIDFNPATTKVEDHYVLLCGYEEENIFCFDPWSASYVSLEVYGGAKRAIIQFRAYDKKLAIEDDPLAACMKDREGFWKKSEENWKLYQEELKKNGELETKYSLLLGEKSKLEEQLKIALNDLTKLNETTNKQIDGLNQQIADLSAKVNENEAMIESLKNELNASNDEKQKKINELEILKAGLEKRIEELQKELKERRLFTTILEIKSLKIALVKLD